MCAPRSPSVAPTIPFSRVNPSCSRRGSVFSAALTFKRRLMNKSRVKPCGCGLFLPPISARTFREGSSWLSRHDSGGNSPRRPPAGSLRSERLQWEDASARTSRRFYRIWKLLKRGFCLVCLNNWLLRRDAFGTQYAECAARSKSSQLRKLISSLKTLRISH